MTFSKSMKQVGLQFHYVIKKQFSTKQLSIWQGFSSEHDSVSLLHHLHCYSKLCFISFISESQKIQCITVTYAFLKLQIKRFMISPRKRLHCSCSIRQGFHVPTKQTSINYYICIKPTVNQSMLELKVVFNKQRLRPFVSKRYLNFILHFQKRGPMIQIQTGR